MSDPDQLAAEALSGLKSREIVRPPANGHDIAGASDLGDHFRCQLGTTIRRQERADFGRGYDEKFEAIYFVVSYIGRSWKDVLAKVAKGERACQ